MLSVDDLFEAAEQLPVEMRAQLVDRLLRTLNATDEAIDREWAAVAKRRLEEIQSGKAKLVPAEEVFRRIREQYSK